MYDSYINMLSSLTVTTAVAENNRNEEGRREFQENYKEESRFEYEFRRVSFH